MSSKESKDKSELPPEVALLKKVADHYNTSAQEVLLQEQMLLGVIDRNPILWHNEAIWRSLGYVAGRVHELTLLSSLIEVEGAANEGDTLLEQRIIHTD